MKGIPVEITLSIFISGTRSSEGMMGIKTKDKSYNNQCQHLQLLLLYSLYSLLIMVPSVKRYYVPDSTGSYELQNFYLLPHMFHDNLPCQ
jgi:hypothetical protein